MRASDKIKVRQRRLAHVALILISFSVATLLHSTKLKHQYELPQWSDLGSDF